MTPLVGAMTDEERAEFVEEQGSRERLRAIIERAQATGGVEVFGCWSGDEEDVAVADEDVVVEHFTENTAPIGERVLYRVRPH